MLVHFIGGTIGTAFGAAAVGGVGWPTTAAVAAAMIITVTVRGDTRSVR